MAAVVIPPELQAEGILLATGLIAIPGRSEIAAGPQLLKDLRKGVLAVLEHADPTPFYVVDLPMSYLDKLLAPPDYAAMHAALSKLPEIAIEYPLLHQTARAALIATKPNLSIQTSLGTRPVEPQPIVMDPWLHQADIVETPMRLAQDFAAAALLSTTVNMFTRVFPKTYSWLCSEIQNRRAELGDHYPPFWLDHVLTLFLGVPFPSPPVPPAQPKNNTKAKPFDSDQLRTPAQETAVPIKR